MSEPIWMGGTGKVRYYRVSVKTAETIAIGDEVAGGFVEAITLRRSLLLGTWAQLRVRHKGARGE